MEKILTENMHHQFFSVTTNISKQIRDREREREGYIAASLSSQFNQHKCWQAHKHALP